MATEKRTRQTAQPAAPVPATQPATQPGFEMSDRANAAVQLDALHRRIRDLEKELALYKLVIDVRIMEGGRVQVVCSKGTDHFSVSLSETDVQNDFLDLNKACTLISKTFATELVASELKSVMQPKLANAIKHLRKTSK